MANSPVVSNEVLLEVGKLALTLQSASLPEVAIVAAIKATFAKYDVKTLPDAIKLATEVAERDAKLANLRKSSASDRFALLAKDEEYITMYNATFAKLTEFRKSRTEMFAYAKEKFAVDLKWQTEEEKPSLARAERAEGSNANGGAEKGGITYANGSYIGKVGEVEYRMIVNHDRAEDATYSGIILNVGGLEWIGLPSPRIASDYVNGINDTSAGQLSAKGFWQYESDRTPLMILSPLPQSYLDWAAKDSRKVVATHVEKYSIK